MSAQIRSDLVSDTSANGKAQIQVTSQHGEGQMLGLQDVQAIQTKLDAHIRLCEDFKAIIEEQIKVLRDRDAEIKDRDAENKVLRDRIQELENELEASKAESAKTVVASKISQAEHRRLCGKLRILKSMSPRLTRQQFNEKKHKHFWNPRYTEVAHMPKCVKQLTAQLLRHRPDLVVFHTHKILGCVHATNDIFIAVAGEDQATQHATACLYMGTTKTESFNLNCLQATAEAIICAIHSRNPILQIYTDMETTAVIYYYVRGLHALVERVFYDMNRFWAFVKKLVEGLPDKATILAGSESFSIAGIKFDRYGAASSFADDIANLADLAAFDC